MSTTKYTREFLEPIVEESYSIAEVLRKLRLKPSGGNHFNISKKIKKHEIDTSHFLGKASRKGVSPATKHTEESFIKEVLCENGKGWKTSSIRKKLLEFNLKENVCKICGQKPFWNDKLLILQLDHINGKVRDNRLENLRIVCPNCHTQTETFSHNGSRCGEIGETR